MATKPQMVNAFDRTKSASLTPRIEALVRRREAVLPAAYRLFYEEPVLVTRAEGVRLYDDEGNAYLDVYNNVPSVGHCHPHVVAAQARQAAALNTHTRYLHELILTYAERLLATYPPPLSQVMFTCTGSEAADLALRIARAHTGGSGVIVTANAYHGVTAAVAEVSPSLGAGVPLGEHVRVVPAPDGYRIGPDRVGHQFATDVRAAIDDLKRHGIKPAALLFDTIFSSDGVFADPPGFIRSAVDAIRQAGGLFIADEVQPGFGRTGEGFWGFSRHGVTPDLVIMGKPMGNGLPIAGVVAGAEVFTRFSNTARYFNTFGGNPVCCAAALAVLEVIENEKLIQNANEVGKYLRKGLRALQETHACIGDVRGAGLFIGVDLVRSRTTKEPDPVCALNLVNRLRAMRILISASGPLGNVLKIRPPLPFSLRDADEFLLGLKAALEANR